MESEIESMYRKWRQRTFEAESELATLRARIRELEGEAVDREAAGIDERAERDAALRLLDEERTRRKASMDMVSEAQNARDDALDDRDAARATVERVREVAARHRVTVEDAKRSAISRAWCQLEHVVRELEAALTPPGDGGSHG